MRPQNQIWSSCSDIDVISDVTPKPADECGGAFGNNEGGHNPRPVAAGSACKCASLCQARRVGMRRLVSQEGIVWFNGSGSWFSQLLQQPNQWRNICAMSRATGTHSLSPPIRMTAPSALTTPKAQADCAGWTYSSAQFKVDDRDCYLRGTWGEMAYNCRDCYSAPRKSKTA